jgi:hypothetical protein
MVFGFIDAGLVTTGVGTAACISQVPPYSVSTLGEDEDMGNSPE